MKTGNIFVILILMICLTRIGSSQQTTFQKTFGGGANEILVKRLVQQKLSLLFVRFKPPDGVSSFLSIIVIQGLILSVSSISGR